MDVWLRPRATDGHPGDAITDWQISADGIRQDWRRVPLPDTAEALQHSARLGRKIAALLAPETPVPGVSAGAIRPELKVLAVISNAGGGLERQLSGGKG